MLFYRLEFWGILCNIILAGLLLVLIYLLVRALGSSMTPSNPNYINNVVFMWTLGIFAGLLIFGALSPEKYDPITAYPVSYYAIVFLLGTWLLLLGSHYVIKKYYQLRHYDISTYFQDVFDKSQGEQPLKILGIQTKLTKLELRRKTVHICACVICLTFVVSPFVFNAAYNGVYLTSKTFYSSEMLHNVEVTGDLSNFNLSANVAIQTLILVLVGAVCFQLAVEISLMLYPSAPFLLHKSVLKTRRESEVGTLGHHVYMMGGFLVGTIILIYLQPESNSPLIINSIIAMIFPAAIADTAAAVVGIQFGEKKWGFNKKKSYIGTTAGMIATYITTIWFVGPALAIGAVAIFILTDVILAKINLCDNFWYPVLFAVCARVFWGYMAPFGVVFPL